MKYGVDVTLVKAGKMPARLRCRHGSQVYAPTTSLLDDLGHDRQRAVSASANDQLASAPGEVLVSRERSVPEFIAVWLRRLLLPFPYPATLDDDVVLVLLTLDLDRSESE
jgi:hypothetical protein